MAGTRAGGLKAKETNLKKYGKNFYVEIGRKGGRAGHTGGFTWSHERAVEAGRKGGYISSRSENKLPLEVRRKFYERVKLSGKIGVGESYGDEFQTYKLEPPKKWLKQFREKRKLAERSRRKNVG